MLSKLARKPLTWVVVGVALVAVAFGLYWFQPWKLYTDDTVDDALPVVSQSTEPSASQAPDPEVPTLLAEGEFITHEHDTTGKVQLLKKPDGKVVLTIAGLDTSNGPDLHVWITDQQVSADGWKVFDDGYYVDLGALKGNKGDQLYEVPASADLSKVTSVSIWCSRFSVSFGAAVLA